MIFYTKIFRVSLVEFAFAAASNLIDFFACDFLIKMDVAKLHLFNNGSHCDESYLTTENDCLKLFLFR